MKKLLNMFRYTEQDEIISSVMDGLFLTYLISTFITLLGLTIDGIIVGNFLGEEAMIAFGLLAPMRVLIELIAGILSSGCAVVCGNLIGSGDSKKANKIFSSSFSFCILFGTFVAVIFMIFPQIFSFLVLAKGKENFLPLMSQYVRGFAPGIPAIMLCSLLIPIVQLEGDKKRIVSSTNMLCVVNIVGDLFVVQYTNWNMLGVALATSLSYYCSLFVLLRHIFGKNSLLRPSFSLSGLKEPLSCGMPQIFNRIATFLRDLSFNSMALYWGGPAGMLAWTVANNCATFLSGFPKAYGSVSLSATGVFYGEQDKNALLRLMKLAILKIFYFMGLIIVIVFLAAPLLVDLYMQDDSTSFNEAVYGLRIYGLYLIPYALNLFYMNYCQATKKKFLANYISFMDGFGFVFLFALLFLNLMDFSTLFLSFVVGKSAVFLSILIYVCIKKKRFITSLEDILLLPEDFDVPEKDQYISTITCKEDAINISEKIVNFCSEHGIDKRRSIYTGLAIEEMSMIIIKSGFNEKKNRIDIKVFLKDEQVTIRIRDNCQTLTASQRVEIQHPEDTASNAGIRIVTIIADSFDYYAALGINNLIIKI